MKKFLKPLQIDEGISYVEVIVAIVILGLASTSLLNSISSENQVANKYTLSTINYNYLSTASEIISKEDYVPCNQNTRPDVNGVFNPYSIVATTLKNTGKNPVQIMEVMALGSDRAWHPCGDSFWSSNQENPSLFQRIKICIPQTAFTNPCSSTSNDQNYYWRYVFKNMTKISSDFNVKTTTSGNTCSSSNPNSYNIVSGYIQTISLLACNAANSPATNPNLTFYTMPGSGPQALTTSCAISSGSEFSIAINSSNLYVCPGKNYVPNADTVRKVTIEIGAIDVDKSIYFNPISLAINTYYPPTLVPPGEILTESEISLFGCASSQQGCSKRSLMYVGGIPDSPVYFALNSSTGSSSLTGSSNFAVDTNLGDLSLKDIVTNSSSNPANFSIQVALSGGGLPTPSLQSPFVVTVNPLININSSLSMTCGTSSCTAGPFTSLNSSGLKNYSTLVAKSSNSAVTPTIINPSYNASADQWSFSVSASFACKTTTVNKVTTYIRTTATFYLSDSVANLTSKKSSNSISFSACA